MPANIEKLVRCITNGKNVQAYKHLSKVLKEKCSKRIQKVLKTEDTNR